MVFFRISISSLIFYLLIFIDINDEDKLKLVNINVFWPSVDYKKDSRRSNRKIQFTTYETLNFLNGWSKYNEICIDGMNGVGKSTLINSLNRKYEKVNTHFSEVTMGSDYNHDPIKSMTYLTIQLLSNGKNICWDRCAFANLIFYYVHYLMNCFKNNPIPNDEDFIYKILNDYASKTNLLSTLHLCIQKKQIPTLFIVCSDINFVSITLLERGGRNDIYNAKEYNYQMAQYYAYSYFANLLDAPLIDIKQAYTEGFTINSLQNAIKNKIDINENENGILTLPDLTSYHELMGDLDKLKTNNNLLFYCCKK